MQKEYECQNCGERCTYSYLVEGKANIFPDIPNLTERLYPGELVPVAECPECEGLMHEVVKNEVAQVIEEFKEHYRKAKGMEKGCKTILGQDVWEAMKIVEMRKQAENPPMVQVCMPGRDM